MKALFLAAVLPLLTLAPMPAADPDGESPQRLTVTLTDPSRPATLKASSVHGSIAVEGFGGNEVIVESSEVPIHGERREERVPPGAEGMHRIPNNSLGLSVNEDNNVVRVEAIPWRGASRDLRIKVPAHSSLNLSCINDCALRVSGVDGDIELGNINGSIEAHDVAGSVVAHTTNGSVKINMRRIDRDKPMAFSSLNGDIDVTFPADLRATVRVESGHGEIYSDFEIANTPRAASGEDRGPGMRRIPAEQEIHGAINGGGPEILFKTFNGNILIHRAKG
jgi:hypothetical protein